MLPLSILKQSSVMVFQNRKMADQEVTAITMKNNIDDIYYTFGCGEYDVENSLMQTHQVVYIKCADEHELLHKFTYHWAKTSPDVVTGWNCEFFDIPYLVNRINVYSVIHVRSSISMEND